MAEVKCIEPVGAGMCGAHDFVQIFVGTFTAASLHHPYRPGIPCEACGGTGEVLRPWSENPLDGPGWKSTKPCEAAGCKDGWVEVCPTCNGAAEAVAYDGAGAEVGVPCPDCEDGIRR